MDQTSPTFRDPSRAASGGGLRGAGEAAAEDLGGGGKAELFEELALAGGQAGGLDDATEAGGCSRRV
jgi:hypothetical protein